MPAKVTTLDREIAKEERCVGIPTDEPLTDRAIRRVRNGIEDLGSARVAIQTRYNQRFA